MVGQRLRDRRRALKLTQAELGELVGLSFQQVQKYEKGINRISAGRLFELAAATNVDVIYYYQGAAKLLQEARAQDTIEMTESCAQADTEGAKLLEAYAQIDCPEVRAMVRLFIVQLAATELGKVE